MSAMLPTTKLTQSLRLRLSYSSEVNEFPEEILEAGGRDDFKDPRGCHSGQRTLT
jgi:hypothetical protein